jgi:hypothetical protein
MADLLMIAFEVFILQFGPFDPPVILLICSSAVSFLATKLADQAALVAYSLFARCRRILPCMPANWSNSSGETGFLLTGDSLVTLASGAPLADQMPNIKRTGDSR